MTNYIPESCIQYLDVCTIQTKAIWGSFIGGIILGLILMYAIKYQIDRRKEKKHENK